MQEDLKQIDKKITLILYLLQGNELNKADTGMIGKHKEMEDRLKKMENRFNKVTWTVAGAISIGAYNLIHFIKELVK